MKIVKRDGRDFAIDTSGGFKLKDTQKRGDADSGIFRFVATLDTVDRQGERLAQGIFDNSIDAFVEKGVVPWAHNWDDPPIGRPLEAKKIRSGKNAGYEAVLQLDIDEPFQMSANLKNRPHPSLIAFQIARQTLKACSVGCFPNWDAVSTKDEDKADGQRGATYYEAEWVELSPCTIGANRDAIAVLGRSMRAFGVDFDDDTDAPRQMVRHELVDQFDELVGERAYARVMDEDGFGEFRLIEGDASRPGRVIGYRPNGDSRLVCFVYGSAFSREAAAAHARRNEAELAGSLAGLVGDGRRRDAIGDAVEGDGSVPSDNGADSSESIAS